MNCGCLLKGDVLSGNQTILEACVLHLAWVGEKVREKDLQIGELRSALGWIRAASSTRDPEVSEAARKALGAEPWPSEKRNDLGLDFATYEAAKKEQAEGKRIPIVCDHGEIMVTHKCAQCGEVIEFT